MKRLSCLAFGFLLVQQVAAQTVDLKLLNRLMDLNEPKLEHYLLKKGYKKEAVFVGEKLSFSKLKKEKSGIVRTSFRIIDNQPGFSLVYQTTSHQEYLNLERQIRAAGFFYPKSNTGDSAFYQKKELQLHCSTRKIDSLPLYVITARKKIIPEPKEIQFAEDLLQMDSHEYLAEAFGRQNMKTDSFHFSDTESKRCTIIFPNTNRQAIFIWKDEENLKDIALVIIGEQLNNEKNTNAVMLSVWRSKQGIYCGMSLREMENLNKEPIQFYNWRTQSAGLLTPENKGALDFQKLRPVFNCMNCGFLYVDKEVDVIESGFSINENQKVYVASFALLPERKLDLNYQTSFK